MSSYSSPYNIIKSPVITEKSTMGRMENNQYSFFVDLKAGKKDIKKAVESVFDVTVESVNTLNIRSKRKRLGRFEGRTSRRKKAVVRLKQGDRIKLMEGP